MRHPTRHPVLAALLVLAFALVTAGCGGNGVSQLPLAQPPSSSPSPTDPPVAVTGVDPQDLDVTDTTATSPGANLSFASPVYSVAAASELTAPARVRLLLDNALPRTSPVFVVTRSSSTNPWTYLPARLLPDQRHVEFTATRLSEFAVLVMDLEGALQSFRDDVRAGLDFRVDRKVDKPVCDGSTDALKDGYSVGHSRGKKTVYWCFGLENGKRVLKVTNRRTLPIQVAHASVPQVATGTTPKRWAAWAGFLGDAETVLPPGRTVTYDAELEPTKHLLVSARTDAKQQSLRALQATAGALVTRVVGFGAGRSNTVNTVAGLLGRPQCKRTIGQGTDKMLAGCFSRRKVIATFGSRGRLLAKLLAAPSTATFLRKQTGAIAVVVQKNGVQNIVVRRAKPDFSAFVGTWTGLARTMVVNADGLVVESVSNVVVQPAVQAPDPFPGKGKNKGKNKTKNKTKGATTTVEQVADVTYQLSEPETDQGISKAQAVITKVKVYDRKAFHGNVPHVGDTGTFRLEKGVIRSPFVKRDYCGQGARKGYCD